MLLLIYDTETNGLTSLATVLMASALLVNFEDGIFTVIEKFNRYYHPVRPSLAHPKFRQFSSNEKAAIVFHKLTDMVINVKRKGCTYPSRFDADTDIVELVKRADIIIGHNIKFDIRMSKFKGELNTFDTMHTNTKYCKLPSRRKGYKWPTLNETATHYNIQLDEGKLHGAWYDISVTYKIVLQMFKSKVPELMEVL